jgi:phosphotransacetylase
MPHEGSDPIDTARVELLLAELRPPRGQIAAGILDGPLALDNAVSEEAAKTKGIVSPVAGRADIFVVSDLEAVNILAKQLE